MNMNDERKEKIVNYVTKMRSEGKLNMDTILSLLDEVERKTREETILEVKAKLVDLW